jgi:uncharacterized membrane protein
MSTTNNNLFSRFIGNVFAGLFLMLPLAVIIVIGLKFYQIAIVPVSEIANKLGIERPFLIELLFLFILIILCFFAGLLMHQDSVARFRDRLESNVLRFVPGYEFVRMRLAILVGSEDSVFNRAVLVKIDDGWSPALLIEEGDDGRCTVFVPDVPKSNSGSVYLVDPEQVRPLNVKFNKLDLAIRNYGKGLYKIVRESESQQLEKTPNN